MPEQAIGQRRGTVTNSRRGMATHNTLEVGPILEAQVRLPQHVVYRTFVYETVVLNLETGKYHGLNRSAGRMLDVLAKTDTVGKAASELAKEFSRPVAEIERDLAAFCLQLQERGLIVLDTD
jgi:hypothetical protein